jgi:hypothetical protein
LAFDLGMRSPETAFDANLDGVLIECVAEHSKTDAV